MTSPAPSLSVLVVSYNTCDLLRDCLQSVLASTGDAAPEMIVVDNNSTDGSAAMVAAEFPQVRLIANTDNRGFAAANNQACAVASGQVLLLLNPDTVIRGHAIGKVLEVLAASPTTGAAGCRTLNSDGTLQFSVWRFPTVTGLWLAGLGLDRLVHRERRSSFYQAPGVREVDWVQGSFLMVRREALPDGLLLDERYFMYGEDKDLCLRMRQAGWRIAFVADAEIIHHGGQSVALDAVGNWCEYQESQLRFFRKHHSAPYAFALQVSLLAVALARTLGYYAVSLIVPRAASKLRSRGLLFWHATRHLWRSLWRRPASAGATSTPGCAQ